MKIVSLLFALLTVLNVHADVFPPGLELTPIQGAQLFCSNQGVMYAINFRQERVWQSDRGERDGLELKRVKITRLRCPRCYDISGVLLDSMNLELQIRAKGLNSPITASLRVTADSETEVINDLVCSQNP